MNTRRWYAPTVLALLAAGGLVFFAASRRWAAATVAASGLPSDVIEVTATSAQPLIPALGLVVAAGGLAVLATRGRLRQLVGALTAAAGVGIVVTVVTGAGDRDAALATAIEQSPAFTGTNVPEADQLLVWPILTVAAAVLAVLLGVLTVLRARDWPAMGGRYEAPGAHPSDRSIDAGTADGADVWKALDEGHDPTT